MKYLAGQSTTVNKFSPLCVLAEQAALLVEGGLVWRDVEADAPEVGDRVGRADVVVVGEGVRGQLLLLGLRKILALLMCQISSKLDRINNIDKSSWIEIKTKIAGIKNK